MTLNQLECFSVLAQRLNFTQAADDLFMSQPALSRTISALEDELGVRLFDRNSRSVSLTPAGKAFYEESPSILRSFRVSVNAALTAQQGYRGELTVGILRDIFDPETVRLYQAMAQNYPEIRLTLRECSHSELVRALSQEEVDAVINFGENAPVEGRESQLLRADRQCAVVPAGSKLAQRSTISLTELREEPFVAMSRTSSMPGYGMLWRMASKAGFSPHIVAEAELVPALLMLVACGVGVSTLQESAANMAGDLVRFIPLEGAPQTGHYLTWRTDSRTPALPLLIRTARELYLQGTDGEVD